MLGELVQGIIKIGDTVIDNADVEEILAKAGAAAVVGAVGIAAYSAYKVLTDEDSANNASKVLNPGKKT